MRGQLHPGASRGRTGRRAPTLVRGAAGEHHGAMAFDVDRLLRLWTDPLPEGPAAEEAFRAVYTDPVTVNGTALSAADLVARARALQGTFAGAQRQVLAVVEDGDRVAVAFRMGGRQVGPLSTSAGTLPPTGRHVELRVVDVLTLHQGLIDDIVMVADELGALVAVDAVRLTPSA
ncbi:MAG TPA: nuclear transport factor 2 family protein [Geodermatophilus sp.]|nr:nuclear transport factor 2 family protein [Geodermatophilus sp.]